MSQRAAPRGNNVTGRRLCSVVWQNEILSPSTANTAAANKYKTPELADFRPQADVSRFSPRPRDLIASGAVSEFPTQASQFSDGYLLNSLILIYVERFIHSYDHNLSWTLLESGDSE